MCVMFYSSFVCISAYANVYFKATLWECLRAGLPPGFPSTAPPPVRVSAVLGTLAVWIPNQNKTKERYIHFTTKIMCPRSIAGVPSSQVLPGYLITAPSSVCVPDVLSALTVWIQNQKVKTNLHTRFVPLSVCDHSHGVYFPPNHRRRSIVFRVLFQQTNKQTHKIHEKRKFINKIGTT